MRNLKRALSLAMASVMLLGMMVVGTSAASFQDVDESNDLEAIEVMNAVEVMQGDERGFRPNDPINRNEIAKVMALLLKLSPEDYAYAVTPFTDVPDWAAPYVAACYANGITNGTSPSTYSGANNVTAVQAARMMLRALGYLKNAEDDGDDWVLATATQASKIGLFDGVNQTAVHAALTRNQVATMAVNALEATMVEDHSDKGLQVNTPDGTTVSQAYKADYRKVELINEGDKNYTTAAGGVGTNDEGIGYQQLCEYLYGTDLKKTGSTAGEFGRPGATWKYKGKEIVGSPKTPVAVYTAKTGASAVEKDLRGYQVGTDKDNAYKVNSDATATVNIVSNDGTPGSLTMAGNTPGSRIAALTQAGTRVELYATDDVIDNVVVINTYVAKVTGVKDNEDGTYNVTMNIRERGTLTDNTIEVRDGSYAKDDVVLVTADVNDDDIKTIQKADVVTGKITATKVDGNGTYVKLDGNQYFTSKKFYNYDLSAAGTSGVPAVDDKLTAYVKNGVVYAMDEVVDAVKDYLYVIDATDGLGAAQAKVAFADGTQAKIDVTKLGSDKWGDSAFNEYSEAAAMKDKIYTYTEDNGDYSLTIAPGYALTGATTGEIKSDSASVNVTGAASHTATNKTVFVDVDGKKAYIGYQNVPNVGSANLAVSCESGTLADIIFIKAGDISDGSDTIFYVRGNTPEVTKLSGGAELRTYDVYVNGVKQKLTTKDMTNTSSSANEDYTLQADTVYYSKTINSDGYLTKVKTGGSTLATNATSAVKKQSFTIPGGDGGVFAANTTTGGNAVAKNGVLTLGDGAFDKATGAAGGKTVFTYDGDTIFMVVTADKTGVKGDSVTSGSAGDIVNDGTWSVSGDPFESIVYVLDVDDDTVSTPKATLVLVVQPK